MTSEVRDLDLLKFSAVYVMRYKPVHTWLSASQTETFMFSSTRFFLCILWLNDASDTAKVSQRTNKNLPASARNTLVQLLLSRYYWTVDNANLLRFTRRSYHLD